MVITTTATTATEVTVAVVESSSSYNERINMSTASTRGKIVPDSSYSIGRHDSSISENEILWYGI